MKKIFEKIELEKWLSALLGIVAIVAIFYEMKLANFDEASVAGAVKDIAGTIIAVVMLIVALDSLRNKKRKAKNFEEAFAKSFDRVIEKYAPVLSFFGEEEVQKLGKTLRYNIANRLDAISTKVPGGNNKFFRIKSHIQEVEFSVSATVFADRKEVVASHIASRMKEAHSDFIEDTLPSKEGFLLKLKSPLLDKNDAEKMVDIIDHILLLYIAEYKK